MTEVTSADHVGEALLPETLNRRLDEIKVIFDHAGMRYFERAELARNFFEIYVRLHFGHNVQNGEAIELRILSEVARELPVGKSDDAKRKWLARALKVASISPEAKAAARKAGIDRFQKTLFEIAEAGDVTAQLATIGKLAASRQSKRKKRLRKVMIRFPEARAKEIRAALATFAERHEVEVL